MIRLTSKIQIGENTFNGVVNCEIESTWDNLTDTAVLQFPRRLSWKGKDFVLGRDPVIKKGDPITINLGYDDDNDEVFKGYVTSISSKIPAEVTCEDPMWLLKQKTITKSYKQVSLKTLLKDMLLGVASFEAPDVNLGPFRINNATPAQVLEVLKNDYLLKSFFRGGKLYVGLAYWAELQKEHTIRFDKHVVENNLEYVRKEDVKIKLTIIVITSGNEKKRVPIW